MNAALWFLTGAATTIATLQITTRILLRQATRNEYTE